MTDLVRMKEIGWQTLSGRQADVSKLIDIVRVNSEGNEIQIM